MMNTVECYAGSTYPEEPRALIWEEKHYLVQQIISRSREPGELHFTVRCSPGDVLFDLIYTLSEEDWQIHPKGFVPHTGNLKRLPKNIGD